MFYISYWNFIQAYDSNQTGNEGDALNMSSDEESLTETRESQREEELSLFWSFIVNMLTNLDAMPIERIHQMLKIFAMQVILILDTLSKYHCLCLYPSYNVVMLFSFAYLENTLNI